MRNDILKLLVDINLSIDHIQDFISSTESFEKYERDFKTQSAIERQLIIIAEAINRIQKIDPEFVFHDDYQIIAFRNRLVHAYDAVDNAIVWLIVKKYILDLQRDVQKQIKNSKG